MSRPIGRGGMRSHEPHPQEKTTVETGFILEFQEILKDSESCLLLAHGGGIPGSAAGHGGNFQTFSRVLLNFRNDNSRCGMGEWSPQNGGLCDECAAKAGGMRVLGKRFQSGGPSRLCLKLSVLRLF